MIDSLVDYALYNFCNFCNFCNSKIKIKIEPKSNQIEIKSKSKIESNQNPCKILWKILGKTRVNREIPVKS